MERLLTDLERGYPKLHFENNGSIFNYRASSFYSETGELTIRGSKHSEWLHELCHLVEREDHRLVRGTSNWALGTGTYFMGTKCYTSSTPWEREVRVWTWQVCVMRHLGIPEWKIVDSVLPQYVPGERPSCLRRVPLGKEQAFVMKFINMKLRLLSKKYSYEAFVSELQRKLDFMLE